MKGKGSEFGAVCCLSNGIDQAITGSACAPNPYAPMMADYRAYVQLMIVHNLVSRTNFSKLVRTTVLPNCTGKHKGVSLTPCSVAQ